MRRGKDRKESHVLFMMIIQRSRTELINFSGAKQYDDLVKKADNSEIIFYLTFSL